MNDLTATQAREQLKTKIATLRRNMKFGVDTKEDIESVLVLVERLAQQPEERKEYKHFAHCNGNRQIPAGEPGHSCSCFNAKSRALAVVEREHRPMDDAASFPHDWDRDQSERVVEREYRWSCPKCGYYYQGTENCAVTMCPNDGSSLLKQPQAVGLREAEYFVSEYVAVVKSKYSRVDCIQAFARLLATPAPATAEKVMPDALAVLESLVAYYETFKVVGHSDNTLTQIAAEARAALERSGLPGGGDK